MFERFFKEILGRGRLPGADKQQALWHYESAERARAAANLDAVQEHYESAIDLDPEAAPLIYNLGLLLQQLGDSSGAEACFKRAIKLLPDFQNAHSSYLCLGDFSAILSRDEIYRRHLVWASAFADPLSRAAPGHEPPNPSRRIRIGYVSADFSRHVTGRFIEPILQHHDTSRFDVFCYSNLDGPGDEMTEHLRRLAGSWRDIAAASDEELALIVRNDKIDILIDLSGHSLGNRLLAFARRPAPVQITWLGYLNTTGMEAMQYRVTDALSDPPGSERWYREELLRLPQPQWCYVPAAGPVCSPAPLPAERGEECLVTFVCATRFMKVGDGAVALWVKILHQVQGSKLRVIDVPNHARRERLMKTFSDADLAGRIEFLPTLRADDYWRFLEAADIALDTFPYTGATTSCDCLWMGVPVVTLTGSCGAARSASSLLMALGLSELCANSADAYVEIASRLGRDRVRLAEIRKTLRERMLNSPVCDAPLFTKHLEQQLEIAWARWCKESKHAD